MDKKKKVISNQRWHNFKLFLLIFVSTIIFFRLIVSIIGNTSLYIFGTEFHHLFFGVILLMITGFIRFFSTNEKLNRLDLILFGVGTGMVVDQFVYIIFTLGDHLSYFSAVSLYGAIVFSIMLVAMFYFLFRRIAD